MSGIIAPRNYAPLDLVHEEEPFAHVVRRSHKDTLCEACLSRSISLKACKPCQAVKYCNKDCQKRDWKDHKYECKHLKNLTENPQQDFVRLLGKVILKMKDKKWKTIQKRVLGTIKTFNDLDSHSKHLKEDPLMKLFCREINEMTRNYIGDENMPEEDDFIEILGKVKYNAFQNNLLSEPSGYFLFIGAPKFDHECIPNCNVDVRENILKVWGIKKINRGSKITVMYAKILSPRSLLMDDEFLKNCKCKECIKPYGESILNRIVDEKRAYSVITETNRLIGMANILDVFNGDIRLDDLLDELIEKQRVVLGHTHLLHLQTLALRCLTIGPEDYFSLEVRVALEELENNMKLVYGEYYLEMAQVYEKIIQAHSRSGNRIQGMFVLQKLMNSFPFAINVEVPPPNIFGMPDLFRFL